MLGRYPHSPSRHPPSPPPPARNLTSGRGEGAFSTLSTDRIREATATVARYRIASMDSLRQAEKGASAMLSRDLRDFGGRTSPHMQLLLQVLGISSPHRLLNGPNAKCPNFEEVANPARLDTFSADLSDLSAQLNPNQDMAGDITLEFARGRSKAPAFAPFVYQRLDEPPWPVASNEHKDAIAKRRGNDWQANRGASPKDAPLQAWVIY